jgi:hypothetical protein
MGTGCGLTLDTGALIALERRDRRMIAVLAAAHQADLVVTVPSPVLVEWFHGKPSRINPVLNAVIIEPLGESLARTAGVALVGTYAFTPLPKRNTPSSGVRTELSERRWAARARAA